MSSDTNLVNGPFRVDALGTVTLIGRGSGVWVRASGADSDLSLEANGTANMTCGPAFLTLGNEGETAGKVVLAGGPTGTIVQTVGPPAVGPQIKMESTGITLSVGPPGVGTSITLGADAITLQVGVVSYKLSLTGIQETMAAVSRKLTPLGHELTAAESSLKVDMTGINAAGPIFKAAGEAMAQLQAAVVQVNADGVLKEQGSMTMLG